MAGQTILQRRVVCLPSLFACSRLRLIKPCCFFDFLVVWIMKLWIPPSQDSADIVLIQVSSTVICISIIIGLALTEGCKPAGTFRTDTLPCWRQRSQVAAFTVCGTRMSLLSICLEQ